MLSSFVRPMIRSCSSTVSAFHAVEVVQVLLHDDVAAAGEVRILVADQGGRARRPADRVLGAVDEAHQVAVVEVLEAVDLVDDGAESADRLITRRCQLEAQVHARARMWKSRSPGVDTAAWSVPAISGST